MASAALRPQDLQELKAAIYGRTRGELMRPRDVLGQLALGELEEAACGEGKSGKAAFGSHSPAYQYVLDDFESDIRDITDSPTRIDQEDHDVTLAVGLLKRT